MPDDNPRDNRLHALDAVRAAALLLGIALHGALAYAPGVDSQLWPIRDSQQHLSLSVTIFLIHVFRMSVFFLVAGFFARMLFHRRGARGFLRDRAPRIVLPLLLGWVACFVCIAGVVTWSLIRANGGQLPESLPPELANAQLNFLHLWFLYILCWLYAGALALRYAVHACDRRQVLLRAADRVLGRTWTSPIGPLLLAAPICIALFLQPDWAWWFGVPTPGYTLVPPAVPSFVYGYVFGLGWLLGRQRALLNHSSGPWVLHLFVGLAASGVCLSMAGLEVNRSPIQDPSVKPVYALCYSLAMVSLTLGFIGLGSRLFSRASPWVRYLSDASYWMYIAHLPLVMAIQMFLAPLELHWAAKFALVNVVSCALLLVAYRVWVGTTPTEPSTHRSPADSAA
jgi:glucans biosynthesis protein C